MINRRIKNSKQAGFALIELLLIVGIIIALAAVGFFVYKRGSNEKSNPNKENIPITSEVGTSDFPAGAPSKPAEEYKVETIKDARVLDTPCYTITVPADSKLHTNKSSPCDVNFSGLADPFVGVGLTPGPDYSNGKDPLSLQKLVEAWKKNVAETNTGFKMVSEKNIKLGALDAVSMEWTTSYAPDRTALTYLVMVSGKKYPYTLGGEHERPSYYFTVSTSPYTKNGQQVDISQQAIQSIKWK